MAAELNFWIKHVWERAEKESAQMFLHKETTCVTYAENGQEFFIFFLCFNAKRHRKIKVTKLKEMVLDFGKFSFLWMVKRRFILLSCCVVNLQLASG